MTLILVQVILQSVSSTLQWVGFSLGIRTLPTDAPRQRRWIAASAIVFGAWLFAITLFAAQNVFRNDGIPVTVIATLALGYLFLFSQTFRGIIAGIPQQWLIGIQTFRILGGVFLIRYAQGQLPGAFAIPAGIGDVLTGLAAPLVAYWWYAGRSYARGGAIVWNLFGMADLVNALVLGAIAGGGGIVFPTVLIPVYAVPRALLIHSYSLIGLLRTTSRQPKRTGSPHYGFDTPIVSP